MGERQGERVQRRTADEVCLCPPVQDIAKQGKLQRVQVRADLVRAPGQRTGFEQGLCLSPFKDFEVRFRGFAPFMVHRRAVLVTDVRLQRHPANFLLPGGIPLHNGLVNLLHLVPLELAVERAVRICCARENHHAAGDFVQPVDDPHTLIFLLQHFQQVRRIWFPAFGEHRKARRFVDNENLIVQLNDVHQDIVTHHLRRLMSYRATFYEALNIVMLFLQFSVVPPRRLLPHALELIPMSIGLIIFQEQYSCIFKLCITISGIQVDLIATIGTPDAAASSKTIPWVSIWDVMTNAVARR